MSDCDFTFSHYEEILNLVKEADYKTAFFNECFLYDKELILRHDIDVDLEKAYRMALLESNHKIRATYFILLRSPFYNIFERGSSDFIRGILDLGHQIGLHFDEAFYVSDNENIVKNVASEVQMLNEYFETNVLAVSFHRPSKFILHSDIKLANGLINTYDRKFTKEFKYISDSRRMWKDGCLCSYLKNSLTDSTNQRIQALLHPIWWTDDSRSAQDTMEGFLLNKLKYLDRELEKNIQIYKKLY